MTRTVTVDVTRDDIDAGTPECAGNCPVALALQRVLGCDALVMAATIRLASEDDWSKLLRSPPEVQRFVRKYDHAVKKSENWRGQFQPFSFTIEVPEGVAGG